MPRSRPFRVRVHALWAALPIVLALFAARPAEAVFTNGKLQVIHLDAGQGDAAVLITPGGQVALFDEGTNFTAGSSPPSCARVLSELQALGVTHVDLHFASHYHSDHIGCITSLTGITIDAGWDRAQSYTTAAYTNYVNYLGAKRHTISKGQVWTLDAASAHPVTITCIAFGGDGITTSDENSLCAVYKISYGEFDEVTGGDLTGYPSGTAGSDTNIETKVGPQVGPVEVYKVHHHGSRYGSWNDWLNATKPKIGIVSCGTGNSYGHPTSDALGRLHAHNVHTYWTETGTGVAPLAGWDKVANGPISIYATWQPGGVDSVIGNGFADTLTNSGTAVDAISPVVSLFSPNGGETLAAGAPTTITWSATDNVGVTTVDVRYSTDGGVTWVPIVTGGPNNGSTPWGVPNVPSDSAFVSVVAHDAAGNVGSTTSGAEFSITDQTLPTIALTAPNGGASFTGGTTQDVTWNASDNVGVDSVNVDYSINGTGGPWQPVAHGIANSGTTPWTLPNVSTDSAFVMVTAFDHALNQAVATSDGLFSIAADLTGVGDGVLRFALLPAVPSPSRGATLIRFSLAVPGPVSLEVFNLAGRRIWGTSQAAVEAGYHSLNWPAVTDQGAPVGTGIYFARLTSLRRNATIKLVLLR